MYTTSRNQAKSGKARELANIIHEKVLPILKKQAETLTSKR